MSEYSEWEVEVIQQVADELGASYSDASGVVESQPFYMQQSWVKDLDPKQTAAKILAEAKQ
jgi:hypothetical protein